MKKLKSQLVLKAEIKSIKRIIKIQQIIKLKINI